MGSFVDVLKTILIPALISFALYLVLTYAILPFYHRYRQRYHQYLPLDTLSTHTSSFRHRLSDALTSFLLPSSWSRQMQSRMGGGMNMDFPDAESLFDDEEGEDMVGFDIDARRREALERRRSEVGEGERRLSRDLEEGFRDESDEDEDDPPVQIDSHARRL
ncbi:MAG: hypothetical protein M1837_003003 [Sclerophora amabilis]|nr:MAG: hypothetical protein M1837_003003 [Sclerophora amabilis]